MNRKKFLQLGGLGAAGLSFPSPFNKKSENQPIHSFPQMVGEVSQTSAILQTRLSSRNTMPEGSYDTPENLVNKDIEGVKGWAKFEISDSSKFKNSNKTPWLHAESYKDFIVKYKVNWLKPNILYYYRVHYGTSIKETKAGPLSQFKTLPAKNSVGSVKFAVSSCMNMSWFFLGYPRKVKWGKPAIGKDRELGYPSLKAIKDLKPDFWVQTGDNVYYDYPWGKDRQLGAKNRKEMRAKWHRQMCMPRAESLLRKVPVYWMVDDHDYRYNDSDNRKNGRKPSALLAREVFREQVPVIDPQQKDDIVYHTRQINRYLQIWTMDSREHRDDNNKPDGPDKSLWGKKQLKWLKQTLLSSSAVFKLLIVGDPLIGPDDGYKHDNHTNYGGFQHERDYFFKWLFDHNLGQNFYIITGDRHWQYHSIHPSGLEEFGTGTLTRQNSRIGRKPGDPHSTDPLGTITQPYIQEKPTDGFIEVELIPPKNSKSSLLKFTTIDGHGKVLNEVKRRVK